jgi:hypothetical protein
MQRRFWMFIAIILVGLLALTIGAIAQRSSAKVEVQEKSDQWEYLVVAGGRVNLSTSGTDSRMRKQPDDSFPFEAYALEKNFDKLGAKGWQLVAVYGNPNEPVYYFKRLKPQP